MNENSREADVYALLAADAVRAFAGRDDWLGELTEAQARHVTEMVLCLIPARRTTVAVFGECSMAHPKRPAGLRGVP